MMFPLVKYSKREAIASLFYLERPYYIYHYLLKGENTYEKEPADKIFYTKGQ